MLPCVPDERPVPQEVLQGEVVHVGPRGRTLPGDLQPPGVEPDGSGGHPFRRVWFDCGVGEKMTSRFLQVHLKRFHSWIFFLCFDVFSADEDDPWTNKVSAKLPLVFMNVKVTVVLGTSINQRSHGI